MPSGQRRGGISCKQKSSLLDGVFMKNILRISLILSLTPAPLSPAHAQTAQNTATKDAVYYPAPTALQTETDEYTRYELLAPETASFKI